MAQLDALEQSRAFRQPVVTEPWRHRLLDENIIALRPLRDSSAKNHSFEEYALLNAVEMSAEFN